MSYTHLRLAQPGDAPSAAGGSGTVGSPAPAAVADEADDPRSIAIVFAPDSDAGGVMRALPTDAFRVRHATALDALERVIGAAAVHLVIAVQVEPGEDQVAAIRSALDGRGIPLLALLRRNEVLDRVAALEMGADACLPHDAHPLELLANARALLRRKRLQSEPPPGPEGWTLDAARSSMFGPQGERVRLRPGETALLAVFLRHPDIPLSRERLGESLRGGASDVSARSIDAHVSRLRARLGAHLPAQDLIETCRGGGYRFNSRFGVVLEPATAGDARRGRGDDAGRTH